MVKVLSVFTTLFTTKKALPSFTILFLFVEFAKNFYTNSFREATNIILTKIFSSELYLSDIVQTVQNGETITLFTFLSALHSFLIIYFAIKYTTEILFFLSGKLTTGFMPYLIGTLIVGLSQSFFIYVEQGQLIIPFMEGFIPFTSNAYEIWQNTTWL